MAVVAFRPHLRTNRTKKDNKEFEHRVNEQNQDQGDEQGEDGLQRDDDERGDLQRECTRRFQVLLRVVDVERDGLESECERREDGSESRVRLLRVVERDGFESECERREEGSESTATGRSRLRTATSLRSRSVREGCQPKCNAGRKGVSKGKEKC